MVLYVNLTTMNFMNHLIYKGNLAKTRLNEVKTMISKTNHEDNIDKNKVSQQAK